MRRSITRSAMVALMIAAAALLLAACGDDEDEDAQGNTAASAGSTSALVSVETIDGTDVLVDSEGRALYTAEQEAGGEVLCVRSCTTDWDPVAASGDEAETADVDADLGVIERPDGSEQLALEGRPLYAFTQESAGQLTGDGLVDEFDGTQFEWRAATVSRGAEASGETSEPAPSGGYGAGGY